MNRRLIERNSTPDPYSDARDEEATLMFLREKYITLRYLNVTAHRQWQEQMRKIKTQQNESRNRTHKANNVCKSVKSTNATTNPVKVTNGPKKTTNGPKQTTNAKRFVRNLKIKQKIRNHGRSKTLRMTKVKVKSAKLHQRYSKTDIVNSKLLTKMKHPERYEQSGKIGKRRGWTKQTPTVAPQRKKIERNSAYNNCIRRYNRKQARTKQKFSSSCKTNKL